MEGNNVMANPSLEIMTIPGVPDYIRPNIYLNWPLVGDSDAVWGVDINQPYHGKQCLRLINQFKGGEASPNYQITAGIFYLPALSQSSDYTFSVYARSKREGEEFKLYISDMKPRSPANGNWKLTKDWKRYSHTGKFSKGGGEKFYLYTLSKDAVIWIDALQMEAGDTPSAFTEK